MIFETIDTPWLGQWWPCLIQIDLFESAIELNYFGFLRLPTVERQEVRLDCSLEVSYQFAWNYAEGALSGVTLGSFKQIRGSAILPMLQSTPFNTEAVRQSRTKILVKVFGGGCGPGISSARRFVEMHGNAKIPDQSSALQNGQTGSFPSRHRIQIVTEPQLPTSEDLPRTTTRSSRAQEVLSDRMYLRRKSGSGIEPT
jgi:hypothetical protein